MATEDLKKHVAREIASGERIADVARRHSYSWKGMAKLVATADVQALIAEQRDALDEAAERYRAQLLLGGETAIENVRRVVEDPDHPRNLDTSRWLLDKVLPAKNQAPTVAVAVQTLDAQVMGEIAESLSAVRERLSSSPASDCSRYTLLGTEGLAAGEE